MKWINIVDVADDLKKIAEDLNLQIRWEDKFPKDTQSDGFQAVSLKATVKSAQSKDEDDDGILPLETRFKFFCNQLATYLSGWSESEHSTVFVNSQLPVISPVPVSGKSAIKDALMGNLKNSPSPIVNRFFNFYVIVHNQFAEKIKEEQEERKTHFDLVNNAVRNALAEIDEVADVEIEVETDPINGEDENVIGVYIGIGELYEESLTPIKVAVKHAAKLLNGALDGLSGVKEFRIVPKNTPKSKSVTTGDIAENLVKNQHRNGHFSTTFFVIFNENS